MKSPNQPDLDQSSNDEDDFNWDEYLKKTNSEAAPIECFCQNEIAPINEFKVGHKLETNDPRNLSSTCLASVIEIAGLRLRLRLDGTDDRNDFWLMCDSDSIHPFEYSAKHGRKIQPPLGYGNDLSKWPKFLEKIIHSAQSTTGGESMFAPESCFKTPPTKPIKNEFKIGQKLEAVDPKNPQLICPATIKDINREKLFISFDGWSQSSQFWVVFSSRDLFPVGWCKKTGHILQHPGTLEEKQLSKKDRVSIASFNTSSANNKSILNATNASSPVIQTNNSSSSSNVPIVPTNNKPKINKKISNKKDSNKSSSNVTNNNNLNETNSSNNSTLNITMDSLNVTPPVQSSVQPPKTSSSITKLNKNEDSITNKNIKNLTEKRRDSSANKKEKKISNEHENQSETFDLSLVKCEAFDPIQDLSSMPNSNSLNEINKELSKENNTESLNQSENIKLLSSNLINNSAASVSTSSKPNTNSKSIFPNVIIYLNPNCDCGKYINTSKFHKSHTRFGPGLAPNVYKSIVQSFIDCAVNRYEVFKMIPEGNGVDFVRYKTSSHSERKKINSVENAKDMWKEIKDLCNLLSIDDTKLFSKQHTKNTNNSKNVNASNQENLVNQNQSQNQIQTKQSPKTPPIENKENNSNQQLISTNISNNNNNKEYLTQTSNLNSNMPSNSTSIINGNKNSESLLLTPLPSATSSSSSASSSSSSSCSSSASSSQSANHQKLNSNNLAQKRRLSASADTHNNENNEANGFHENFNDEQANQAAEGALASSSDGLDFQPSYKLAKLSKMENIYTLPINEWSIEHVVNYILSLGDYFTGYIEAFRHHEIDGKALLLLTTDILMKYMGFKLGPALKLNNFLDKLRQNNLVSGILSTQQVTTKTECTNYY